MYDMLCVLNPAVDSLKELDLKLIAWKLVPGPLLGDSVGKLLDMLTAMELEKVAEIEEGNPGLAKEMVLKLFRKVTDSTSGKLHGKLLSKYQAIYETPAEDLESLATYAAEINDVCTEASENDFKSISKTVSKYGINQLNTNITENNLDYIPGNYNVMQNEYQNEQQNYQITQRNEELNNFCTDDNDSLKMDLCQMTVKPRNHPLADRADYLRRTKPHMGWKPRDRTQTGVTVYEGEVFTDSTHKQLTRQLMEHFDNYCYKCGHFSHTGQHYKLYENQPLAFTLCTRCRQGFHTKCESIRADLLFKDRALAQAASLEVPTQQLNAVSVQRNATSDFNQLKHSMDELANLFRSAAQVPKGNKLQKQVTNNENKLKAIDEAQTQGFAQINEVLLQLCKQQSIADTALT